MFTVKELRNAAREALEAALKLRDGDDRPAFEAAWADYQAKNVEADAIEAEEAEVKAATAKYAGAPSEIRDGAEALIKRSKPADAKEGVLIQGDNGPEVVGFAGEGSEGWIKGYPASVQHPFIVRRLGPELRAAADEECNAFWKYCRWGQRSLTVEAERKALARLNMKALQEGVDAEGGFLVPTDAVRLPVIMARGVRAGVGRAISQGFTTTRDAGDWPATTDNVTWAAVAEEAALGESDPTLSQVPFSIHKFGRINKISQELLEDSAVDLPALLGGLFTRGLGRFQDQQVIEGDGSTEPLGIRTTGAVQGDVADSVGLYNASTIPVFGDVLTHYFALPAQWRDNLTWFTTSSFLKHLVGIVGAGIPRVVEFMGDPIRPVILGRPVAMFDGTGWDDAAAIAVNEEFGCVGDFSQYFFINRVGMAITRLDELYQGNDQIGFKARTRYDSFFAENDAFRIMKAAAA